MGCDEDEPNGGNQMTELKYDRVKGDELTVKMYDHAFADDPHGYFVVHCSSEKQLMDTRARILGWGRAKKRRHIITTTAMAGNCLYVLVDGQLKQ